MKTFGKLLVLAIFFGLVLWTAPAAAGEAGIVSCSTPDCGYHVNLKIGGGMRTPAMTGYCRSTKKFVRVKLKSWERLPGHSSGLPRLSGGDPADLRRCRYCQNPLSPMRPFNATL